MTDETKREFLKCLQAMPPENRTITAVFAEFDTATRDRLTPAFDLFIQASDAMDEMRRLRALAYKVAQAELAEELGLRVQHSRNDKNSRHARELKQRLARALGQGV